MQKKRVVAFCYRFFIVSVLLLTALPVFASNIVNHRFAIKLDPATSHIDVDDVVRLPAHLASQALIHFLLHDDLEVSAQINGFNVPLIRHKKLTNSLRTLGDEFTVSLVQYTLHLPPGQDSIHLHYHGAINHPLKDTPNTLSQTPGLISEKGVFLSQATLWYPLFVGDESGDNNSDADDFVTFTATITLPDGWQVVSQGDRTIQKSITGPQQQKQTIIQWTEDKPQDDIYLVAARFHQYQKNEANVQAMVFLREDDAPLAQQYLDATGQYIAMYSQLLGPYPYAKFALVENFWETGFGMPSFTLLGPQVIRFPFIIYSSYPHEILHNWWGNSVYVDYDHGNWSEGLTAYLADHLLKEQQGQGAEYRRSALQKYTDYVSNGRDFPLSEFRSRHSSATEAVGYGKSLMLFHMLREKFGDQTFIKALRHFYRQYQFKEASFSNVQQVFSDVTGVDLKPWFAQWVDRTGAPDLRVQQEKVRARDNRNFVRFILQQHQPGPAYQLRIPLAIQVVNQPLAFQTTVTMTAKEQGFSVEVPGQPLSLIVDPEFDVFRRLDSREIPAAMSQGFGAERGLILLPSSASPELQKAYRLLAQSWQKRQAVKFEIKLDSEVNVLPHDRTVWILGWNSRFEGEMRQALISKPVSVQRENFSITGQTFSKTDNSFVVAARNPANKKQTLLWMATNNAKSLPGLARKLPHYRKYSYLVFHGDAPQNTSKGQWLVTDSPMWKRLVSGGKQLPRLTLKPRLALAQLPHGN